MRKVFPALLGAAALALSLGSPGVQAGKDNDTLVWSTDRDTDVLSPDYNNTREAVIISRYVWDTLLYRNDDFEYEPLLATSYKWVNDTTLEFELRQDVEFHNGKKFKAEDVAYTINHVVREDSGVLTRRNVSWMKSAEVLGEYKVRLNLVEPFPAALEFLAGPVVIYPKGLFDNVKEVGGKKDFGTAEPIGTGPYRVSKQVPAEQRFEFTKNDKYFDGPKGKPSIGKIVFRVIADPEAQIAELLTGGVDWLWDVPKDKAEQLDAMGQITVVNAPTMRISYLQFNNSGKGDNKSPFMNKKVRQAVAHAINRESIAKNLVGGASNVIHSACFPTQFGCTDDGVSRYEYDPAKAKKLLAEAGYPGGFETEIYAYRQREFTEAAIGDLAKVGIQADLKYMQYKALRGLVWDSKTVLHQMTWGSYSMNDASAIVSHFFKLGRDDYAMDTELKGWLDVADTSTDPAVRKENYKKALQRISGELYWLPMFTYAKYYAFNKNLDFTPTPDEIPQFFRAKWK